MLQAVRLLPEFRKGTTGPFRSYTDQGMAHGLGPGFAVQCQSFFATPCNGCSNFRADAQQAKSVIADDKTGPAFATSIAEMLALVGMTGNVYLYLHCHIN